MEKRIVCIFIKSGSGTEYEVIRSFAEACFRFTPHIQLRGEEAVFLDITQCLKLYSENSLKARLFRIAKYFHLNITVTYSNHPSLSLAKIYYPEFDRTDDTNSLPIESLFCFLNPFKQDNHPLSSLIEHLKSLGIYRISQFLELPRESLGSRFGEIAVQIHRYASAEAQPVWNQFQPRLVIEESVELENDSTEGTDITIEPLLFTLRTLMDRAMSRLRGISHKANKVSLHFQLAPWSHVIQKKRTLTLPLLIDQGTSVGLMPLLREQLFHDLSKNPLPAPVRVLKFRIDQSIPSSSSQRDFFETKEAARSESWDQLLSHLLSQYGRNRVFAASFYDTYVPEQTWVRVLPINCTFSGHSENFSQNNPSGIPKRPSRLLKTPETLLLKPAQIIHPASGRAWNIVSWKGPERIATQWWNDPSAKGVYRDYYQIITHCKQKLWIFIDRNHSPPQVFLHGYFD